MIYPKFFSKENDNLAEKIVFDSLKKLSSKYDIFYSIRYLKVKDNEPSEYEIDFIIAIPNKLVLCIEVKGGMIRYDGKQDKWFQNGYELIPNPIIQATGYSHNLIKRYTELAKYIPIEWAICFPDCELPKNSSLPASIIENRVIDKNKLLWVEKSFPALFTDILNDHKGKSGCKHYLYENFKSDILRDINFVQKLGTTIKHDEDIFIELTESQTQFFKKLLENRKIITSGPAGSGKTIIAKTVAKDFSRNKYKVLFVCFNRTLSNKIRYEQGINHNDNIKVCTFHSLAREIVEEQDKDWWCNHENKNNDFWELELPSKFDIALTDCNEKYDVLVIDEGQDFGEFWFESIFKLVKKDGHIFIFLDELQNIFNRFETIPNENEFTKFRLEENCRNTKKIINYLEDITSSKIKCFSKSPEGSPVIFKNFESQKDEFNFLRSVIHKLITDESISSDQILLMLNSDKNESCLKDIKNIGNFELVFLDNKARFNQNAIHYTNIDIFKGLETDILFLLDIDKIDENKYKIYTEASRAIHKIYILRVNEI